MNILISGIHGFVGSNFIRALKDKHTLYGLDIVSPAKEGVVTTFSWQDFEPTSFPFQTLPQFDAIIHLAGKAHDTKNQSAAQSYFHQYRSDSKDIRLLFGVFCQEIHFL